MRGLEGWSTGAAACLATDGSKCDRGPAGCTGGDGGWQQLAREGPSTSSRVENMLSPVSKEDLISVLEFSPVDEVHHISTNNTCAMDDLLDLTGHMDYPKLSPVHTLGDCNKNLIEGCCNPGEATQLVQTLSPPLDKLNIQ
ncbi:hypothetical protein SKAU_G00060190 [Synaphobranchus kaupii]|uniref:Uncharacterized protein n=1 Tax=Synaphobranchus kaupii TaxID=118154 RepID=A0A9Q1G4Q1_SYNKA|nr:hypothetical protein SKAU_G00060190 [Synaphobranchus kaupii]